MVTTLQNMLTAIERSDPDGGKREPTDSDYARHRSGAIEAFGVRVWDIYRAGGWSDRWSARPE